VVTDLTRQQLRVRYEAIVETTIDHVLLIGKPFDPARLVEIAISLTT